MTERKIGKMDLAVALIACAICVLIIIGIILMPPATPYGNYPDQNTDLTADTNKTPQATVSKSTNWCYSYFLHKYDVLYFTVNEDGNIYTIDCNSAEKKGFVKEGDLMYAENIDVNGIYCQCSVYYGMRQPYQQICFVLEDQNAIKECLNTPITGLGKYLKDKNAATDLNGGAGQ